MSKNKVKLLLIEDYIELNRISLLCDNMNDDLKSKEEKLIFSDLLFLKNELLKVYEKVFFRFGLMDVSYLLLKKSLKTKQEANVKLLSSGELKNLLFKLKLMVKTLELKLKKLSLNEIELNYIIQNLSV